MELKKHFIYNSQVDPILISEELSMNLVSQAQFEDHASKEADDFRLVPLYSSYSFCKK